MDLNYYDTELNGFKEKITAVIMEVRKLKGEAKTKKIEEAEDLLNKMKKTHGRFRKLVKESTLSKEKKNEMEEKKKYHSQEHAKLCTALDLAKSQSDRDLLLNDPKAKPKKEENDDEKKEKKKKDEDDEKQTAVKKERMKIKDEEMANQLFKDIFALNDESMGILERIERSADDAQATAAATLEKLKMQEEQFKAIDSELDTLNSNVNRAKKELVAFARGIARQKCIFIIIILVLLAVLAVVGVVIAYLACPQCRSLPFPKIPGLPSINTNTTTIAQ